MLGKNGLVGSFVKSDNSDAYLAVIMDYQRFFFLDFFGAR